MTKSYIPDGLSEDEFTRILTDVSTRVAPHFRFGYNSNEDMIQQGMLAAIVELQRGKFKPRGEKPLATQLRNFLYVWIYNRLSNYRRDKSCRYPNVDSPQNKSKYGLMHPLPIYCNGLTNSEIFARSTDTVKKIALSEITHQLIAGFTDDELTLYQRYLDKNLKQKEMTLLQEAVLRILPNGKESYV